MFENITKRSFKFNLLVALGLCVVLYILFFISLGIITAHGKELKIPGVVNKDLKSAIKELEDAGFDVYVDSTYEPKQKPLLVLQQMPEVGAIVKKGRMVLITVNKTQPPLTPMPNLMNLSFRSAEMLIRNNKLVLGDTTYEPDIAKGAVLRQLMNGIEIRPGQMVPQGSRISLVIGDGLGNTQINVPDVIGLPFPEGMALLESHSLTVTPIFVGDINDTFSAIISDQSPKSVNEMGAMNRIKEGDIIDITIKQNPSQEELDSHKRTPAPPNNEPQ